MPSVPVGKVVLPSDLKAAAVQPLPFLEDPFATGASLGPADIPAPSPCLSQLLCVVQ